MAVEPVAFEGFGAGAVAWFEGLERDNSKPYFDATRATFEDEVREPLELLLTELAPEFEGEVHMFRQHRDVRFSPDKSPYKTATYGVLRPPPGSAAALYAQVSSRGLYAGSGYWRMANDQLEHYREAVLDDAKGEALGSLIAAVKGEGLEFGPPSLKTAPRGMPRDHPRVELLRYKDLVAGRRLLPGPALATREALDFVAGTWRAVGPLNAWLDEHVGRSELPREVRGGGRRR
jgi:uncharacterized protein (TIGR02453 family)